jgi:hypothetical protein
VLPSSINTERLGRPCEVASDRLGLTVLMAEILSVVSAVYATESPEVDPNQDAIGEPFGSDARVSLSLPLRTREP